MRGVEVDSLSAGAEAKAHSPIEEVREASHAGPCMATACGVCQEQDGCCARVLRVLIQAAAAGYGSKLFNWVFHNPYCGLLFRCGCTWPWAGGGDNYNFHNPTGPKCPWCNVKNTSLAWLAPAISTEFALAGAGRS